MIQITSQLIEKTLSLYNPSQRLLLSSNMDYPRIGGKFLIGPTYYISSSLKHATDIEIQLCLNQLAYVGVAQAIISKINKFNGLNFENLQNEGMLILESKKRFKRQIPNNQIISGEINLRRIKEYKNNLFISTDFQFENHSVFGSLELAIVR